MPARPTRPLALVALAAVAALTGALAVGGCSSANARPAAGTGSTSRSPSAATSTTTAGSTTVAAGSGYLALGDSISFGYREPTNTPKPDYPDATSFVGFPEDVAAALGLQLANAACSGETSTSLVTAGAPSNGCENSPGGGPGYRDAYPLHVSYQGTQLSYAVTYLKAHPDTRLVTLMIGANDGFLCQETTKDGCVSELAGLLTTVQSNVRTILGDLRQQAGYRGQIVILNYYSTDYTSTLGDAEAGALNTAMDTAAKPYSVSVADGYAAFKSAAAQAGGKTCVAGLLTTLSGGGCGVHPSVAGQALLALTVERAIRR